ncbi:MAG: sugar phosphate isomerase/epimerase [Oscillospiraceae bacterium]|nr:sugar phosphate isomerase/epimerase [Oscillospiraceae bacterium]
MQIGLQTFTVRKLMKTPGLLERTFAKLSQLGVVNLELAVDYLSFPFNTGTAKLVAKAARENGIAVRSCQIKYSTAAKDVPATAAFMGELGAEFVVNSLIDLKLLHKGEAGLGKYCSMLNVLGERLAKDGIRLAHHNHHYEFIRVGDKNALEYLAQNSDVLFALDTYWIQRGGGNILTLLEELRGRVPILHLRDYAMTKSTLLGAGRDCEIGRGSIPFKAVLKTAEICGVQYGMIEQNTKTPLTSIEVSLGGIIVD